MIERSEKSPSLINCHTHVFVGANIPPFIGKTFMAWPLYRLISIPFVLFVCRFWYLSKYSPKQWKYSPLYKKCQRILYNYRAFTRRHTLINLLITVINLIIIYHAILYLFKWVDDRFMPHDKENKNFFVNGLAKLEAKNLFYNGTRLIKWATILFTLLFIAYGRKIIFFMLKQMVSFLSMLPNKKTLQFLARYLNIGRFAYYKKSAKIFIKLKDQYPAQTGFVLLPMDMEFMDAGPIRPEGQYSVQMDELAKMKQNKRYGNLVFPFIGVDPRRTVVGTQRFFDWEPGPNGSVILKDCFIKEYLEEKKFSGFKIYPALGYYPFDEVLLPLWKYAADNKIPILTHCIRGTIFYRGTKKKVWGNHPVFQQADGNGKYSPLLLPELKNVDFINNFTHPLNYLCLVEEKLLRIVVEDAKDARVKQLFGYSDPRTAMTYDLDQLKLCFGHFGGEDEWQRYFENDRDDFTSRLVRHPTEGLQFVKPGDIQNSFGALEFIWKNVDWYTIISSMMLQKNRLYADISYIIHDDSIYPLLKKTLANPKLKNLVLFGTDFYVVRNHKSEKEMLADMRAALNDTEYDLITLQNPKEFLNI